MPHGKIAKLHYNYTAVNISILTCKLLLSSNINYNQGLSIYMQQDGDSESVDFVLKSVCLLGLLLISHFNQNANTLPTFFFLI